MSCVIACVVDILCSCKQGFLLVQAALESELKAKEETHIAMAAAEEAGALVKVGIHLASTANIANNCFRLQYS